MSNHSPIPSPPPELVRQWEINATLNRRAASLWTTAFAAEAAQWGADQELEACCQELPGLANFLRDERRPKPPSLKEQALELVNRSKSAMSVLTLSEVKTIRQALETLPND